MLGKKHNAAGETAVEKPLRGKVPNQTFPPSLEIAQRTRDSHFPPAAATAGLRLHFQCLDDRPQGYIFKWLDTGRIPSPTHNRDNGVPATFFLSESDTPALSLCGRKETTEIEASQTVR
jgi:hypothetical protein